MTIYIDQLQSRPHRYSSASAAVRLAFGRYMTSCHMITDSDDNTELHQFATKIGMKLEWFQSGHGGHYDLNARRRQVALQYGAISISRRDLIRIIRSKGVS